MKLREVPADERNEWVAYLHDDDADGRIIAELFEHGPNARWDGICRVSLRSNAWLTADNLRALADVMDERPRVSPEELLIGLLKRSTTPERTKALAQAVAIVASPGAYVRADADGKRLMIRARLDQV